jgi:DNA-binding NtrC family response regulator
MDCYLYCFSINEGKLSVFYCTGTSNLVEGEPMRSILIVSDKPDVIQHIQSAFTKEHRVGKAPDKSKAFEALQREQYDLVFIDLNLLLYSIQTEEYHEVLAEFKRHSPTIEIVILAAPDMIRQVVKIVKSGASDYLTYPITPDEVQLVTDSINHAILQKSEIDYLRDQFFQTDSLVVVQTNNAAMQLIYNKIRSVAPTKTAVLLIGETGSGKGIFARLIHQHSSRRNAPFINIHSGAIPETLIESELFGHEKGAFTGAIRRKLGKFEIAKGGTIFLDEVGTILPSAQVKLLQVLQDGTFSRVGGEETLTTDARIITATNSDLMKMSEEGQFRKDLYYRLNVFPIEIPPLRERIEDLSFFINVILKKLNQSHQKNIHKVHPAVLEALKVYSWPGNIRELENLIERAYILESDSMLTPESFPVELFGDEIPVSVLPMESHLPLTKARHKAVEDFERQYLKDLIFRNKGKIKNSAEDAGITTRQLHKLMSKYGIRKEDYRVNSG